MNYSTKETALKVKKWNDIPAYFTGVVKFLNNYYWFVNGIRHREDGPAVIFSNGSKYWWLNGWSYFQEEWFNVLTPEQKEKFIWNMDNW